MLTPQHIQLLEARGIDVETAAKYGVVSSNRPGGDWISIPYVQGGRVVNHKHRTLGQRKEFSQDAGAVKCFWNFDVITDATLAGEALLIAEGELDALAAIQSGFPRTVSVPDGAPSEAQGEDDRGAKYSYVRDAEVSLRDVREIILCTDADGPGINLMNDLAVRLGRARCKWVRYPRDCKDLNDALVKFGARGVAETIARAQWMRVDGVYRLGELPPLSHAAAHDIGIVNLHHHYKIRLGDFCVVTGIPGHGKTSFVNEVCCRMVLEHRFPSVFASFEQRPQLDHRRNLRTFFGGKLVKHMDPEEIRSADAWIDKWFSFIVPSEDDDVTLAWTLERCAAAILQYGARIVVIDPWNEMDHIRPGDMSLTEYTGFAIKQFRKLASKYHVHVIVCAHPVKQRKLDDGSFQIPTLYDISDSAHWYNKADIGIVVHRKSKTDTIIRVAKSRYHDEIGEPGDLLASFNRETGRYTVIEEDAWRQSA